LDWLHYRRQTLGLFGALAAVVVAIVATDLATGGDTQPPPALGTAYPTSAPGAGPRATRTPRPPTATPRPTTPTVTPTPEPGAGERDLQRRGHLERLAAALEEYREEKGAYPDTAGNIQTFCAYEDADLGCKLKEVLDPLPAADPLGEALVNGYWYASDGQSFVVYAIQEEAPSPDAPQCERPDALTQFDQVQCVRSKR